MNTPRTLLAALVLTAPLLAQAQGSLAERRQAITKGTAPGKVLIEAPTRGDRADRPADAASAAPPAGAAVPAGPAVAAPAAPARAGLLSRLPPPGGRSLADSRRLDAPDQGIVVKPATPASAPR
ncbi:MAG: hypothetical protein O9343_09520 [Burkholderiaceae bacterium]|jgi:hypothetical protein|nr:hypothetical protein [Burkholderiaceae bacterium]